MVKVRSKLKSPKALCSIVLAICSFQIAFSRLDFSSYFREAKTGRILSVHEDKTPIAHKWKDGRKLVDVPKLIHFMLLGENPHQHLDEMVKFNTKKAEEMGFTVIVWKDEDAEKLVEAHEYKFPGLKQSWEYVKADDTAGKYAKEADFIRNLVMWAIGGVHLDADFVICDNIDFLLDEPGVLSFPVMPPNTHEVNGCAMSAPPHHRLFEIALDTFINEGKEITWRNNLIAAGPMIMSNITDKYFKEVGVELDSIFEGNKSMPFEADPLEGVITINNDGPKDSWKATVADIRFRYETTEKDLYHVGFRSWQNGNAMRSPCFDQPELIIPYLEGFCGQDLSNNWLLEFEKDCGKNLNNEPSFTANSPQ